MFLLENVIKHIIFAYILYLFTPSVLLDDKKGGRWRTNWHCHMAWEVCPEKLSPLMTAGSVMHRINQRVATPHTTR